MQMQHLTPHQFEPYREYVDTLIITSFEPAPLDIAAPFAASAWIVENLAQRLLARFGGRTTHLDAGATLLTPVSLDMVSALPKAWFHPLKYVLWFTDRTLVQDAWKPSERRNCVILDWWQWLRRRVPEHRLADAWSYLAFACPQYWNSPARQDIGMPESMTAAMAAEGRKLLDALEEWAVGELSDLWQGTPNHTS
ncbi:hypothetical protein [Alicyclobacillus pomorum]|uniref:hypothetical protein n=1 Tax=Alicyclobacillus pomorum TaxID=204470 RepID=UPI00040D730F|nr:hypothetical protein [Alicyclobacillus pomorum]